MRAVSHQKAELEAPLQCFFELAASPLTACTVWTFRRRAMPRARGTTMRRAQKKKVTIVQPTSEASSSSAIDEPPPPSPPQNPTKPASEVLL